MHWLWRSAQNLLYVLLQNYFLLCFWLFLVHLWISYDAFTTSPPPKPQCILDNVRLEDRPRWPYMISNMADINHVTCLVHITYRNIAISLYCRPQYMKKPQEINAKTGFLHRVRMARTRKKQFTTYSEKMLDYKQSKLEIIESETFILWTNIDSKTSI